MSQAHLNAYQRTSVHTASRGEALLALYDGILRFGAQARVAIVNNNPADKGVAIGRAQAIITELRSTLDHARAPELCRNLEQLYNYYIDRLFVASVRMEVGPLDEVMGHVEGLRHTWAQAVTSQPSLG